MADAQFPAGITAEHIARFSARAEAHTFASYAIMALIFGLFGVCGYIFFQAQDIDRSKSSVELFQEIKVAKQLEANVVKALEDELKDVQSEAKTGQRTTLDVLTVIALLGEAQTKLQVLDAKEHLALEAGYVSDVDATRSKEEREALSKGLMDYQGKLGEFLTETKARLEIGEVTHTDIAQVERVISEATLKKQLNDQGAKVAMPASQLKKAGADVDTLSLVATSLIRFGGVAVTLFLMAVLVPIYRYNVRMSSYYLALADALTLCKDMAVPNFKELVALLMPLIAFDREPKTPVDAVSSVAKEAAGLVKKVA